MIFDKKKVKDDEVKEWRIGIHFFKRDYIKSIKEMIKAGGKLRCCKKK